MMLSTVPAWNATRRGILDHYKIVVEPQIHVDGVGKIQKTDAIHDIIDQLSKMTAEVYYYLARNFDEKAKRDCCLFHHSWMIENIKAKKLYDMLAGKVDVWSETIDDKKYVAKLLSERFVSREGELSLELYFDRKMICAGSFTIVPAPIFDLPGREAILVARIQGGKDKVEDIRMATKAMSDVAPRAVFFALVTGIAKAVGIDHVVGVSGDNYVDLMPEKRDALERQYDDFFKSLEAVGPQNGFYVCNVWADKKPVNSLKAGHRVRTRRKRLLKEKITESAMISFSSFLSRPVERRSLDEA